jgi:hypothetical protein
VVTASNDEMLESIRAGAPSDAFLGLVTAKVGKALRKAPPPNGTRWTTEELEDVAGEFIVAKWMKISAVVWNMENDNQLRSWVGKVAVSFVADRGRETPRGRLTHRVKRIIGDLDDLEIADGLVRGPTTGNVPASDRDALLQPLWEIPITTAWWQDPGEDPTPGDRDDIIVLARHVLADADGPVALDLLVDILAYRLNLPVGWHVGYLDRETASAVIELVDEIPPASKDAATRLLGALTQHERIALALYAEDPEVSAAKVGAALGRSKSTGATVKSSLVARLNAFAAEDREAEAGIRSIGRDLLTGRFDPSVRSDSGGKEVTDAG